MADGNATVQLLDGYVKGKDAKGNTIDVASFKTYTLWIVSLNIALMTQYDSSQLHRGKSWFPIRRGEQSITFDIDWPGQVKYDSSVDDGYNWNGFKAMQDFQNAIIRHQQLLIARNMKSNAIPMTLTIFNNSQNTSGNEDIINYNLPGVKSDNEPSLSPIVYKGWIDTSEKEYTRFKSVFRRSYRMNILNKPDDVQFSNTYFSNGSTGPDGTIHLIPNAQTVEEYTDEWKSVIIKGNATQINIDWIPN